VRVWGGDDSGQVLASHEDKMVSDLPIELAKYPEIIKALDEGQKVIVSDVAKDALTQPHLSDLSQAGISSILVIPIVLYDNSVGSLLLRGSRSDGPFSSREISFCEIVAEAAANALEKAHLFESIQKANEGLEFLAVTDGLTGLYNHRYFRDRLADEFERATRYKLPLSCLILDVDNFKRINDTFGHLRGDSILKEIAGRVVRTVRKADIVARYGGEEIVVIMPQTNADGAMAQAERIRRTIAEVAFGEAGNAIHVTASVGVGVLRQESMRDCEALIREADSALYQAKAAGKNNVILGGT
jgi:diguanylate cyclase (GGDEF)-like protein